MVDVLGLLATYGPAGVSAGLLFLVGRWLLRAQVIAAWIRVVGIIVMVLAAGLFTGVISLDIGRLLWLYDVVKGVIPV